MGRGVRSQRRGQDDDTLDVVSLYDQHARGLLRWFQSRTYSGHVAADLLAETFAVVLEQKQSFDPGRGEPVSWLWGIARNLLRRYQRDAVVEARARHRLGMRTPVVTSDDCDLVDRRIDIERLTGDLADALGQLSEGSRRAIDLRVVEGRPYESVAEQLGCTVPAARQRVSRALSALSDDLDEAFAQEVLR